MVVDVDVGVGVSGGGVWWDRGSHHGSAGVVVVGGGSSGGVDVKVEVGRKTANVAGSGDNCVQGIGVGGGVAT